MQIPLLTYIAMGSQLGLVVTASLRYKVVSDEMKLLAAFFAAMFLISSLQVILAVRSLSNLWIYHFANLISYSFYLWIFSLWQPNKRIAKFFRREFIVGYVVIWLVSKVTIESFDSFDYFSSGVAKVVTLCIVCYTMITLVDRSSATLLYDRFLILSGVLISSISSALVYSSANLISYLQHDEMVKIWSIHWTASIIANLLFATAFLLRRTESDAIGKTVNLPFAFSTLLKKQDKDWHSRYIS